VDARKARIAAQAERAAAKAFDLLNQKLDSDGDKIPVNQLVPIAGVSVDKLIALRGGPGFIARIEHVQGVNIFQMYNELVEEIRARAKPAPSAQLALPDKEADADSGR